MFGKKISGKKKLLYEFLLENQLDTSLRALHLSFRNILIDNFGV